MSSWSDEDGGVGESDGDGNRMGMEVDGVQVGTKVACESACASPEFTAHANKTTRSNTTGTKQRAFKRLRITTEEICKSGRHKSSSSELESIELPAFLLV